MPLKFKVGEKETQMYKYNIAIANSYGYVVTISLVVYVFLLSTIQWIKIKEVVVLIH